VTPDERQERDDAREAKVERCVQMHYRPITAARAVGMSVQALEEWLRARGRGDLWDSLCTEDHMTLADVTRAAQQRILEVTGNG